jgi:hypothetical protein
VINTEIFWGAVRLFITKLLLEELRAARDRSRGVLTSVKTPAARSL